MTRKIRMLLALLLVSSVSLWAAVTIKNVSVTPRWPWNGLVDITYSVECDDKDENGKTSDVFVFFSAYDNDKQQAITLKTLTGDGVDGALKSGGTYTTTWNSSADKGDYAVKSLAFTIKGKPAVSGGRTYMVVELHRGTDTNYYPVRYTNTAPDTSKDDCRTTELWLRRIPKGTFTMGSPTDELGRYGDETQHQVTLTQDFYIGVFEVTQRQWELVMGTRPSYFSNEAYYAIRPVECVSYNMISGTGATAGAGWPAYGHVVDEGSFMGKLQAKTGLTIDLPTESQWEYACRKKADGTCCTTALNSGKDLTATETCPNMAEVGRYWYNGGSEYDSDCDTSRGTAKVGSYKPSELGLYDMHGNVREWCLDWYGGYPTAAVTDPAGATSGSYRVRRGGGWGYIAVGCRAANRSSDNPDYGNGSFGFRAACLPVQ